MSGWLPVHKPVEMSLLMSPTAAAKMEMLSLGIGSVTRG